MNRRFLTRVITLVAALGLAVTSLLLLFLLLGRSTAAATPGEVGPISDVRAQNSTFTISGTVMCEACGATSPISDVEVYVWNRDQGTGFVGDTTDSSGYYSVTLDLPSALDTYSLEFTPPPETGLNARAFTTIDLMTDTVVNVDFCVCSGVWVSETVDSTGDVLVDTSLALAPTYPYTPHISYGSNGDLKHAWLSGTTWLSQTVDPNVIYRGPTSLALAPTYPYTPCISYRGLKFAYWDGITWITCIVDSGHDQGLYGISLALAPTYPYTPHISYNLPWGVEDLKHAWLSGTFWCSGEWRTETVDSEGNAGGSSSLEVVPTSPYTLHISYAADDDLKHAWLNGATWLSETVDSGENGLRSTSLALDSSGNPHISYQDFANLDLKHAWLSGTTWFSETVDSEGNVGYSTSLMLDSSGNLYISYYDSTNGDLRLARFDGTVWIIQTVESKGWFGWTSLALDQAGCPHISYCDYEPNYDLKYAYLPPVCRIYLPIILKSY